MTETETTKPTKPRKPRKAKTTTDATTKKNTKNIKPARMRLAIRKELEHRGLSETDTIGALMDSFAQSIVERAEAE